MTTCCICGLVCTGLPDADTAFCEDCYVLNLAGDMLAGVREPWPRDDTRPALTLADMPPVQFRWR